MNAKDLAYYRAIGKIQACAATAKDNYGAICGGLKIILDNSMADYAAIWYADASGTLAPYYWIGPFDLTRFRYAAGQGVIGRVSQSGKAERLTDFAKAPDEGVQSDLAPFVPASLCVVPFAVGEQVIGCIEFIKKDALFTDEECDVCELLTLLTQMAVEEEVPYAATPEDKKVLIAARDIKKSFRNGDVEQLVLKGVNFDVFEGEFLCFLGESGCGKSTMLNIIGGMLNADSGSLTFDGRELIGLSQEELTKHRRDNIGFVFQSYNLMPNLTARENLDLIGELVPSPMDSSEALEKVGMGEKKDNYPSQLSGGQQQRVSIARALIKKPRLILADEPTAALDYETSIGVLSVFEEIIKTGTTLVMVTHNEEITKMADRVIRFRNGKTYEITVNRHRLPAKELEW